MIVDYCLLFSYVKNYITVDPKQWVDSRTVFKEQGQTHEKALRTLTAHCLGKKCKIRPRTTKGNKKRDKPGDKGETRPREGGHTIQHQGGHLKKP